MSDQREDTTKAAVFGALDGYNTALAVAFGTSRLLLPLALTISLGGALSMAAGEFVSALHDPHRSARTELPAALSMGAATFLGTFLPTIPVLLLNRTTGVVLALCLGLVLSLVVGHLNGQNKETRHDRRWAYLVSVLVFVVVLVPTAFIGLIT